MARISFYPSHLWLTCIAADLPKTGTSNFLGESSDMPAPKLRASSSPSPSRPDTADNTGTSPFSGVLGSGPVPDPSVWSPEQQQQFLQALMGGAPLPQLPSANAPPPPRASSQEPLPPDLAAMLAPPASGAQGPDTASGKRVEVPKTLAQKLMPVFHFLSMWMLLAYFAFYHEPKAFSSTPAAYPDKKGSVIDRWASLLEAPQLTLVVSFLSVVVCHGTKLMSQPFFWAFTTTQLLLHSLRIFLGYVCPLSFSISPTASDIPQGPCGASDVVGNGIAPLATTIAVRYNEWTQVQPDVDSSDGRSFCLDSRDGLADRWLCAAQGIRQQQFWD
jgi:hypothetical protein